jgi:hypothetical protein
VFAGRDKLVTLEEQKTEIYKELLRKSTAKEKKEIDNIEEMSGPEMIEYLKALRKRYK